MTFKEYEEIREELKEQLRKLDADFIEENKPCKIGDIIEVPAGGNGIVTGFKISWQRVQPVAMKIKKTVCKAFIPFTSLLLKVHTK